MIENDLSRIATALELIAAALTSKAVNATPLVSTAPAPVAPVAIAPAPVPVATPSPVAVVPNVPTLGMPPAPNFTPSPAPIPTAPVMVTPTVAVSAAPATALAFPSKQDMMDFVISSYKALGPEKGAKIQGVLEVMGYKNINDVPDAQWGQLKAGIEGLK